MLCASFMSVMCGSLDTFSICDETQNPTKNIIYNIVSLDTTETNNSFVCDFTQNTLEIRTNANVDVKFYISHCVLLLREKC